VLPVFADEELHGAGVTISNGTPEAHGVLA
jgi:hypothetical protein